jgi:amino acid adenylation domain-containing protein/non-ribosomal peptide synthase protein (TIGR01720 family)
MHGVAVEPAGGGQLRVRVLGNLPEPLRDRLKQERDSIAAHFAEHPLHRPDLPSIALRLAALPAAGGLIDGDGTRQDPEALADRTPRAAATLPAGDSLAIDLGRGAESLILLIAALDAGRKVVPHFAGRSGAPAARAAEDRGGPDGGGLSIEGGWLAAGDILRWCRAHAEAEASRVVVDHLSVHPQGLLQALAALLSGALLDLRAPDAVEGPIDHVSAASAARLEPYHRALGGEAIASVLDNDPPESLRLRFFTAAPDGAIVRRLVLPELALDVAVRRFDADGSSTGWDSTGLSILAAGGQPALTGTFGALVLASDDGAPLHTGLQARRRSDGTIEMRVGGAGEMLLAGRRVDLAALASAAERSPLVRTAHATVAAGADGAPHLALWVVPSAESPLDQLDDAVRAAVGGEVPQGLEWLLAPVSSLPLGTDGLVDEDQLKDVPVMDPRAIARWIRELERVLPPSRRAVVVAPNEPSPGAPYEESELIVRSALAERENEPDLPAFLPEGEPALSFGAPLDRPAGMPVTLLGLLRSAAERGTGGIVLIDAEGVEERIGYETLFQLSLARAAGLAAAGVPPGAHVLLQASSIGDLLAAYWACFAHGAIPLAIPPVTGAEPGAPAGELVLALSGIVDAAAILCSADVAPLLTALYRQAGETAPSLLVIPELESGGSAEGPKERAPGDIAILFPTSGTTGRPKLVQQSHENLLNYALSASRWLGLGVDDVSFNWMPLDHVGGLSMFHLRDMLAGMRQIHADKSHILGRPLRWIDHLSAERVTITWAPNFAYSLVTDALAAEASLPAWNLGSVRHIMNGGEMISADAARGFVRMLRPFGLRSDAIRPCWGMSETCSGITLDFRFDADDEHRGSVCVGPALDGTAIRVIREDGSTCVRDEIGHLAVGGKTITPGYYGDPERNAEVFSDGWFRTGDFARLDPDGRLYITGRAGDTIIINGINRSCQEIEEAVERHAQVESGLVAACPIREAGDATDAIALFFHPGSVDDAQLAGRLEAVRAALLAATGLAPRYLIPIDRDAFPTTSLGKIQRPKLKAGLQAGEFDAEIRRADEVSGTASRIPNWFYERAWLPAQPRLTRASARSLFLFPQALHDRLKSASAWGEQHVALPLAIGLGRDALRSAIADSIGRHGPFDAIVDCRLLDDTGQEAPATSEAAAEALERPLTVSLEAIQGWSDCRRDGSDPSSRLVIATPGAFRIDGFDAGRAELAVLPPLVKSAALDLPELDLRLVDVDPSDPASAVRALMREVQDSGAEPEILWRGDHRFAPRLSRARLERPADGDLFPRDGLLLVTGGLGGVGQEVCGWVARQYGVALLIAGQTDIDGTDEIALLRRRRLETLRAGGARIDYARVDIAQPEALAAAVAAAEAERGTRLAGVLHMATSGHLNDTLAAEGGILALKGTDFRRMFDAKARAGWALSRLVEDRPDIPLILFSSVAGQFGGMSFGAYSAANGYLDRLAADRSAAGGRAISLAWSVWDRLGMGAEVSDGVMEALRRSGFSTIGRDAGMASLAGAIASSKPYLLVGLDGARLAVAGRTARAPQPLYSLLAVQDSESTAPASIRDAFGSAVPVELLVEADPPRLEDGSIDAAAVLASGARANKEAVSIQGATEQALAELWRVLLKVPLIDRADNFFGLGGNSILATQLILRIADRFGVSLPVSALFRHATVEALAAEIDRIAGSDADAADTAPPKHRGLTSGPATPPQKRLWLLHQFDQESAAYNVPLAVRLRGVIDEDAIGFALADLARRHQAFRIRFEESETGPVQIVEPRVEIAFERLDASGWSEDERQAALDRAAATPFDLGVAPLVRALVLRTGEREALFLLNMHHAIVDGWSLGVIAQDFADAYVRGRSGTAPRPLEVAIDYLDYSAWLAERLDGGLLDAQAEYWKQTLSGAPALLALPTDRPRPAEFSYRGALLPFKIPHAIAEEARAAAQAQGTTLFAALNAALAVVLSRYSGQSRVVIGTPVANRPHPALEGIVGMFVNNVALALDVESGSRLTDVLAASNRRIADALSNADFPFERLLSLVGAPRDPSHSPIFQVMLVLQTAADDTLQLPDLVIEPLPADPGVAKYDLNIAVVDGPGDLDSHVEYAGDLFDPATVQRIVDDMLAVLALLSSHPRQIVGSIDLPSAEPSAAGAAPVEFSGNCYHRFVRQVERQPEAPAVVGPGPVVSFAQLAVRVDRAASQLARRGAGIGTIVGVSIDRSTDLIATMLAVLKLGAIYVPLPPSHPAAYRAFLAADAGCSLVVAAQPLSGEMEAAGFATCDPSCFDAPAEGGVPATATLPAMAPAYVIYTSGSTGRAKGVVVTQAGLDNMAEASVDLFGDGAGRRMLRTAGIGFDMSIFELLLGVLRGAAECPLTTAETLSAVEAGEAIRRYGVTDMLMPPTVLAMHDPAALPGVERIMSGGEACPPALAFRWAGDRLFYNGYGPTETTICASAKAIDVDEGLLTIGTAIRGLSMHVLNSRFRRQPVGVVGELHVSGIGVASHYAGQPGLTADRFIPDPFADAPGAVMYRTGDLCRQLANGEFEFVGRDDQQVKVRGHRIELTEIESVLSSHEALAAAAVVATKGSAGATRLIAFLAAPDWPEGPVDSERAAALKQWIEQRRPDYFTPHRFVVLHEMPLTVNGKLDRKALVSLVGHLGEDERRAQIAPETQQERELAAIWCGLFGLERVGVTDNFFELGGDSMVGMRMISAVREIGYRVTAKQIFSLPTIAQLAPALDRDVFDIDGAQESFGTFPVMPMAHWLIEQELEHVDHWNQVITYSAAPSLSPSLIEDAFSRVLSRHAVLGARFDVEARTMTLSSDTRRPPMARIDLSGLAPGDVDAVSRRVGQCAHRSFDIAGGTLCRPVYIDQGQAGENAVWLFVHHLVSDIVSLSIIDDELGAAIAALEQGAEPVFGPASHPIGRWIREMAALADDPGFRSRELAYWRSRAGDAMPDALPEAGRYADTRYHESSLGEDVVSALLDPRTHEAFNTEPLDLLLAAFGGAGLEALGEAGFTAALEGHGRQTQGEGLDISRTIGWFTTLQPVVFEGRADDPADTVVAAKEARRGAPTGGLGYGLLRYVSTDPEARGAARAVPEPEAAFNFAGASDAVAGRGARALRLTRADTGSAHDPESLRPFRLDANCGIAGGTLWLRLGYDPATTEEKAIERLAAGFAARLREILDLCRNTDVARYSPMDFADLELGQEDLDALIAEINEG